MKFVILTEDRNCNNSCVSEHGLSIYMEVENHKLLLDTGITDAFLKNAENLGINLDEVDKIVLSHGHWDHGNGLKYINKKKTLILHPECYTKRYSLRRNMEYAGINETKEELLKKFELIETKSHIRYLKMCGFLVKLVENLKCRLKIYRLFWKIIKLIIYMMIVVVLLSKQKKALLYLVLVLILELIILWNKPKKLQVKIKFWQLWEDFI